MRLYRSLRILSEPLGHSWPIHNSALEGPKTAHDSPKAQDMPRRQPQVGPRWPQDSPRRHRIPREPLDQRRGKGRDKGRGKGLGPRARAMDSRGRGAKGRGSGQRAGAMGKGGQGPGPCTESCCSVVWCSAPGPRLCLTNWACRNHDC
jgi:hypothetical protein